MLRNTAGIPTALGSPLTVYQITPPSTITGIEALRFESQVGTQIQFIALQNVIVGSGLTAITGGAGRDFMVEVVFGGGEFTVSNYQLTNWTLDISDPNSDVVTLVASSFPVNGQIVGYTLNAREGLATTQSLLGAAGNDTLNGSSGSEFLDGRGGVNVLRGNGGRDGLIVANVTPFGGMPTNLTYAGSLFDGGDGIDSLLVSGVVDFQGTLQNIERIAFNPAFTATGPGQVGQAAAHLLLSGANLAALPRDLVLFGNGTLSIDLDPGQVYDASGYVVLPGFTVAVNVTGSSINDTITLGALAETVDDDGGIDTVVFGGTRASYAFGVGANGEVLIGDDVFTRIELFQFSDGLFGFDGFQLVPAATSGSVADGYIAGATVWIDVDGDSVQDPDEPFAISDAAGRFTIASTASGALRATGGTNIDTGLANTLLLSAPDGAGVINPLTTLIENLIADGASAAEAEAAVEIALGLDPDLDLTQLDLIAAAATDPAALEALKAAATVAEVIGAVVENGGDQADALDALAGLIDDAGDVGGTVDLTATETLTTVIGAGLPGVDVTDLVEDTQAVAEAIDAADDLDDVTEVQGNTAPTAVDDLAMVDEDATVFGNVITGSDSDPDAGQVLSVTSVNGAALTGQPIQGLYGTLTIAAGGSYSYVSDADVTDAFAPGVILSESFEYAISDGTGGIASATLSFDITTIPDNRTLNGGNGADTLSGDSRDDILLGGRGDDTLAGDGGSGRVPAGLA